MGEKITFTGSLGEELAARLDKPEGKPSAYVLFAHCFTCGKDLSTINRIAKELSNEGIALFRFDFTGLGLSNGDFANTNFSSNVRDLIAAADYMRTNLKAPKILMGHSLGGAAVLAAAKGIKEAKAVATIGAPFDVAHVTHNFEAAIDEIKEKGEADVELAGRPFKIKKQFLEDVSEQNQKKCIKNLNRALLIMHSPIDETVSVENARQIYETAEHPKSFISLDKADHLLMQNTADGVYVAKVLAAWASRYIEE